MILPCRNAFKYQEFKGSAVTNGTNTKSGRASSLSLNKDSRSKNVKDRNTANGITRLVAQLNVVNFQSIKVIIGQ